MSGEFRQSQKVYDVLFGENVHESEKNKLTLDTELESLYLVGGFGVALEGEFHREKRRAIRTHGAFRLTPPVSGVDIRDITTGGFWFFAGRMRFAQSVTVRREADTEYVVELVRLNAPAAAVMVNGKKAGTLGFAALPAAGDRSAAGWRKPGGDRAVLGQPQLAWPPSSGSGRKLSGGAGHLYRPQGLDR